MLCFLLFVCFLVPFFNLLCVFTSFIRATIFVALLPTGFCFIDKRRKEHRWSLYLSHCTCSSLLGVCTSRNTFLGLLQFLELLAGSMDKAPEEDSGSNFFGYQGLEALASAYAGTTASRQLPELNSSHWQPLVSTAGKPAIFH